MLTPRSHTHILHSHLAICQIFEFNLQSGLNPHTPATHEVLRLKQGHQSMFHMHIAAKDLMEVYEGDTKLPLVMAITNLQSLMVIWS